MGVVGVIQRVARVRLRQQRLVVFYNVLRVRKKPSSTIKQQDAVGDGRLRPRLLQLRPLPVADPGIVGRGMMYPVYNYHPLLSLPCPPRPSSPARYGGAL